MDEVNPDAQTIPETQGDLPEFLKDGKLEKLVSKEITVDSLNLSPTQFNEFGEWLNKQQKGGKPSQPAPVEKAAPVAPAPKEEAKPGDEAPKLFSKPKKDQAEIKAAEANRWKQKFEHEKSSNLEFKRKLTEIQKGPVKRPDNFDPFDQTTVLNTHDDVQRLKQQFDLFQKQTVDAYEAKLADLQQQMQSTQKDSRYLSIEKLQNDKTFGRFSLNTSVPIAALQDELSDFSEAVGGFDNVNRYLTDANFKAQVEAQGLSLSKGFIDNLDKFNTIFEVEKLVDSGDYKNLETAYLDVLRKTGKLSELLTSARIEGATQTAQAISNRSKQTPVLTNSNGASVKSKWTMATARSWLESHKSIQQGTEDAKTLQEIQEHIAAGLITE